METYMNAVFLTQLFMWTSGICYLGSTATYAVSGNWAMSLVTFCYAVSIFALWLVGSH